jgi:pimeloyl-ACP methyl ester carboxylesterase
MGHLVMRYLEAADTTFYEQGKGEAVVLVHGAGCDYRVWEAQREHIASAYRYTTLNLHYHGTEPWPDDGKNYSIPYHVAQVTDFLNGLGAGPVHLIGQSYGGHIATRVAMQHPELVRCLVLQEPAIQSLVDGPEAPTIMEERQRVFGQAAVEIGKGQLDVGARLLMEGLINKGPGTWDACPDYLKIMVLENARTLPLFFAASPAPPINREQLAGLAVPTLIINGEETLRFYFYIGKQMAKCIPNSQRAVIANAAHGIETQNPVAYWEVLRNFLNESSKKSAPSLE